MENNDKIIKFLAHDGKVNVVAANTTYMVNEARKTHDLSPTVTAALGRLMTITAIMGIELKSMQDNLTVQVKGEGPIGTMLVVSNMFPKVKACVQNPRVEVPLKTNGKIDVSAAVGKTGFLNIIKDIGLKTPYIGTSPIISGEIAEDFTHYFATSEQKPTVVALGVLVDKDGVKSAGGYVITLMPDATESEIVKIEEAIKKVNPISKMLEDNMSLEEIAKAVSGDNEIKIIEENIIPAYECDCSKEKMERGLIAVGKKELQSIIEEDGKAEIECRFCNKKYNFTRENLEKLLAEM